MESKVAVCTLTADRRWPTHSQAIPHQLEYSNMVYYVNIQTRNIGYETDIQDNWAEMVYNTIKKYSVVGFDRWCVDSTWMEEPKYDQDQTRLTPICIARNMARMFAMNEKADWLLFLDSDVRPPRNAIQKLLEVSEGRHIIGGVVPGRGAHAHLNYLTPVSHDPSDPLNQKYAVKGKPCIDVRYATCGFMLVSKACYEEVAFTYMPSGPQETLEGFEGGKALSEDPAFAYTALRLGYGRWRVRLDLKAEHLGPLSEEEVSKF